MRRIILMLVVVAIVMAMAATPAFTKGAIVFTGPLGGHIVVTPSGNVNGHCASDLCNFHF